mmetsp:Transcript_73373/g.127355  ORF Transcript_73373/g.127355 Transcript_73373/m.127355 type:complete len:355 (+) Transcript_73373:77-1141(+)
MPRKTYHLCCLCLIWVCQPQALHVPHHSVSGVSSGADMALNHLVAFSSITEGAAIVAGAPYGCNTVEDNVTDYCGTGWPSNHSSWIDRTLAAYMEGRAAWGLIDPLTSLTGRRIYLYSGQYDWVVNQNAMRAVRRQLAPWTGHASILSDFGTPSTHGWIVDGSHCGPGLPGSNDSWCSTCCCSPDVLLACSGHDLAGRALHHLLGRSVPYQKGKIVASNLMSVPQASYLPAGRTLDDTGLWHTGYVYAPGACRGAGVTSCSVHVHYHGCVWGVEYTGKKMLRRLGLMEWAEAMSIILVFPQASSTVDEGGCWDWTGEVDPLFDTQKGPQLDFVMSFLADLPRLLAESDSKALLV